MSQGSFDREVEDLIRSRDGQLSMDPVLRDGRVRPQLNNTDTARGNHTLNTQHEKFTTVKSIAKVPDLNKRQLRAQKAKQLVRCLFSVGCTTGPTVVS